MSTPESGRTSLTSLPRLEDIPRSGEGYEPEKVREAFEAFRRHTAQLQAQLRVLQAASQGPQSATPTGHAVRMDALHLIRAAAEFADAVERDAQAASVAQLGKTGEEIRRRLRELQEREAGLERYRAESERQRAELLTSARNEAREVTAKANREATQELTEAEARGDKLLEQARHQATELANATRAEVEQTLEWARAQASAVLQRAQSSAEQLLTAAGLAEEDLHRVTEAIVNAANSVTEASRAAATPRPAAAMAVPPVSPPRPEPTEESATAEKQGKSEDEQEDDGRP